MEYLGLLFEIVFLAVGLYVYLFALGKLPGLGSKKGVHQDAEAFRQRNAWWLRLAGLALMAVSVVNLYLHVRELLG